MKRYLVDATFPMEDGSLGEMSFPVAAETIQDALAAATEIVNNIEALDLTIWSVCEAEEQPGEE